MSQRSLILKHLKAEPITPIEALKLYGALRLAARVSELRTHHKINTRMVKRGNKRFAQYSLA